MQRASAKKILLQAPKSFHDWKQKFFFIKVGIIQMRMTFRGKEDIPTETIQTPFFRKLVPGFEGRSVNCSAG
ncbi:hypothetical protein Hanom_Chr13g01212711 [Helianthus anomalus]